MPLHYVDSLKELDRTIDRFVSVEYGRAALAAMELTMLFLQGEIPEYPDQPNLPPGTIAKTWTDKQRRYFFWALKNGKIKVPYKRTGLLGRRITSQAERDGVDVTGSVGLDVPYAPWVVGPPRSNAITIGGVEMWQQPIHQGRRWQFYDVVYNNLDEAYRVFSEEFWKEMSKSRG